MNNKVIQERLVQLRCAMRETGIDYYMIPTADFHNSEYVNAYFKVREYFSNFTGSNGTLVIWQQGAGLWTDGRYFIQAEKELQGTGIVLFRMDEEGVPTIEEFLYDNMEQGESLGFDGRVVSAAIGTKYEQRLSGKQVKVKYTQDIAEQIWTERPMLPHGNVTILSEEIAGMSVNEKLQQVRAKVYKEGADGFLLTKLDDIMWLFNIRGCDVECNPVALSYGYIGKESQYIFLQASVVDGELTRYFKDCRVEVKEYEDVAAFLCNIEERKILADKRHCNYTLYKTITEKCEVIEKNNPTEGLKAVKNRAELSHMEEIYVKDSVAVTKFIFWLKNNIGKEDITEISAADFLEQLRRQIPEFLDLSFPTIAGYKANAAMMHYEATEEQNAKLLPEGMLLVDSGGQYIGGTTDVTRTIVLGGISDEIKAHYTAVTAGMLQLSNARWLYGCTGRNLDILARQPLWNMGIDYKCGTGHGVGYILNVHEGPQNLRWRFSEGMMEVPIEAGMDITNEPGVYIEGSHGIRIENVMVAVNDVKNSDGQFMRFDTLTYVPIDLEAIEVNCLTDTVREYLNAYHRKVYEKIAPYLDEEERKWLKEATKAV